MQLDDRVGDAIERAIRAHHRRRLRRLGWEHALDALGPAWARSDPPPRAGNAVEVLVDGAQALPRIAEELRRAESHVHLDARERPLHCHHEKLVVVDDRVAFVGGIDLTSYAGDRFDASDHPARGEIGWHDAAVRLEGPVVADVAEHFALRWREGEGETDAPPSPAPAAAGRLEVQLVRTVPERIYDALPRGDFRILESYVAALRAAERLVYLESQFLWSSATPPSRGRRAFASGPSTSSETRRSSRATRPRS